jgi:hypothetical protein
MYLQVTAMRCAVVDSTSRATFFGAPGAARLQLAHADDIPGAPERTSLYFCLAKLRLSARLQGLEHIMHASPRRQDPRTFHQARQLGVLCQVRNSNKRLSLNYVSG